LTSRASSASVTKGSFGIAAGFGIVNFVGRAPITALYGRLLEFGRCVACVQLGFTRTRGRLP
jgi:hypothetical protein